MNLAQTLPNMSEEEILELTLKILENEIDEIDMQGIMPFMSKNNKQKLVDSLLKERKTEEIYEILPILDKTEIKRIIDKAESIDGLDQEKVLPYLDESMIKKLVNKLIKKKVKALNCIIDNSLKASQETLAKALSEMNARIRSEFSEYTEPEEPKEMVEPVEIKTPEDIE